MSSGEKPAPSGANGAVRALRHGFLLVHHAIRHLMHQAAHQSDQDPDRISFTRSLRVVRRQVTDQAAFSPGRLARAPAVDVASRSKSVDAVRECRWQQ